MRKPQKLKIQTGISNLDKFETQTLLLYVQHVAQYRLCFG